MIVNPIHTPRISAGQGSLQDVIAANIPEIPDGSVLAITSKIVSLCENSVVPVAGTDRQKLIEQEADLYIETVPQNWMVNFTIRDNILIPNAGIDESNAGGVYVLWPRNAQQTANSIRRWLADTYQLNNIGVVITDSTVRPLRRGVSGIALAYSGFRPLRNYVRTPDLFGRLLEMSQADLVGGLASTAVFVMGEGAESTPLALISDIKHLEFVTADPSSDELQAIRISLLEDLFAPFLQSVAWQKGGHHPK